jgi:RNA polymerase sigma-70 factor, ECF subfamily
MVKEQSDLELITRLPLSEGAEKQDILLALYERYKNLVLKVCYHYINDYDQANDVFHDIFVKVVENAGKIQNPGYFRSWLMTITRNLCVDFLRRSSYVKKGDPLDEAVEVTVGERTEDVLVAEMDRQRILAVLTECLKKLDSFHLTIFKLRWQGLKSAQIQKITKTEKAQLRRAYDRIKNTLETCMESKGRKLSIERIISLGELDE